MTCGLGGKLFINTLGVFTWEKETDTERSVNVF